PRHSRLFAHPSSIRLARPNQRCLNVVEKRVNLAFVITASSERWLRESHVADLLWSKSASRGILQRRLHAVEIRVNLGLVITASSEGWLREGHVADLLWSKVTARRQRGSAGGWLRKPCLGWRR